MDRLLPAVLLLPLCLLAGCTQLALLVYRPAAIEECPGPLPPIDAAGADFVRRVRIQVESGEVKQGYDIILQKTGSRLIVVGLTRFGAKAFTIVQTGSVFAVRSQMEQIETVPPANILRDLHRWPLQTIATDPRSGIRLEVDGHTATLNNRPCGYRATIVDLATDESDSSSK